MKSRPATKQQRKSPPQEARADWLRDRLVPLVLGLWIGLALLKFGNPIILDRLVTAPTSGAEFIYWSWPFMWGCVISAIVLVIAFGGTRWSRPPKKVLLWLPAAWFGWQVLAGARSVAPHLTNPTLVHFGITVAAFYAGYFVLSKTRGQNLFWVPVLLAFAWSLLSGFDQHYGGLEATREAFFEQEDWQSYPEEYVKKMQTDRIFGTLVYPNAFATVILMLGPVLVYQLWRFGENWPRVLQGVLCGVLAYMGAACLVWTGSKGGWLVGMAAVGALLLQFPAKRTYKVAAVAAVIVLGLAAFFVKYGAYFQKGAPSVGARFTYWSAAWQTATANPVFGTGPGTFAVPYGKIKPPDAEMTRLVHNDYLEQASDSGWLGLILYVSAVFGILGTLYRYSSSKPWLFRLVLIGILAWALQSFIEFGLYIPGVAWPAFLLLGWAFGQAIDGSEAQKSDP